MASFLSPLIPINKNNFPLSPQIKTIKPSKIPSSRAESSPEIPAEQDPVKIALAKAKSYKNSVKSGVAAPKIVQNPTPPTENDGFKYEIEDVNVARKSEIVGENEGIASKIVGNLGGESDGKSGEDDGGGKEIPLSVKLALEKAKEYKKDKGVVKSDNVGAGETEKLVAGYKGGNTGSSGDKQSVKNPGKKDKLTVSSLDFVGLGFADKKSGRDLPAGLVPLSDPFQGGELHEVEILVGDMSQFDDKPAAPTEENDTALYKPKVSTWGVFPRPNNISKTYGGGRTLRPGEALETPEERAAKEARTRELLAAYKSKYGLNIDPKLKSECEKL